MREGAMAGPPCSVKNSDGLEDRFDVVGGLAHAHEHDVGDGLLLAVTANHWPTISSGVSCFLRPQVAVSQNRQPIASTREPEDGADPAGSARWGRITLSVSKPPSSCWANFRVAHQVRDAMGIEEVGLCLQKPQEGSPHETVDASRGRRRQGSDPDVWPEPRIVLSQAQIPTLMRLGYGHAHGPQRIRTPKHRFGDVSSR